MRIGELARRAGVTTRTIRHYERIGVLPATDRTQSGYRLYHLLDHLEDAVEQHRVHHLGHLPLARVLHLAGRLVRPQPSVVLHRALEEPEGDHLVFVLGVAQVVGAQEARRPLIGLPGLAEAAVALRL